MARPKIDDAEVSNSILKLFDEGKNISQISKMLHFGYDRIQRILFENGKVEDRKYIATGIVKKEAERNPITWAEIENIRMNTKPGDKLFVTTHKTMPNNVTGNAASNGFKRKAVVVSTGNKRFCIVRLENGVVESILWSSIALAKRNNKAACE